VQHHQHFLPRDFVINATISLIRGWLGGGGDGPCRAATAVLRYRHFLLGLRLFRFESSFRSFVRFFLVNALVDILVACVDMRDIASTCANYL
jgi:hypothetical protein